MALSSRSDMRRVTRGGRGRRSRSAEGSASPGPRQLLPATERVQEAAGARRADEDDEEYPQEHGGRRRDDDDHDEERQEEPRPLLALVTLLGAPAGLRRALLKHSQRLVHFILHPVTCRRRPRLQVPCRAPTSSIRPLRVR